jgi:hypothetical protein
MKRERELGSGNNVLAIVKTMESKTMGDQIMIGDNILFIYIYFLFR